jgi:hypothetical protein
VEIAVQLTHHLVEPNKEARKKVKSWTGDLLQVRYVFSFRRGCVHLFASVSLLVLYPKQIIGFKLNMVLVVCM